MISVFAIVILSVLGVLFRGNHPELVGGEEDPTDGPAVAATVFTAVIIYAVGSICAIAGFCQQTPGLGRADC